MISEVPSGRTHTEISDSRYDSIILAGIVPVAAVVCFVLRHLDAGVALHIQHHLYANRIWHKYTSLIPDALLLLVVLITVTSFLLFRLRLSKGKLDRIAHMYKMLAFTAPVSYMSKSLCKFVFGRITTREWLRTQGETGFHWFNGTDMYVGFPSGHMMVITAIAAVMWRWNPRFLPLLLLLLFLLASALIATNYHFISDVIAGAYLGLLVEVCIFRVAAQKYVFNET